MKKEKGPLDFEVTVNDASKTKYLNDDGTERPAPDAEEQAVEKAPKAPAEKK